MLAYTLSRSLTQRAVLEREEGARDEFGGIAKAKRVVVGKKPIPCRFWWWKEGGARSASKEYATPTRTINFTGGGIIVRPDVDVRDGDWVTAIQDTEGNVVVEGPFRVVAVEQWGSHTECALMRP
jgi:hypothetical protein